MKKRKIVVGIVCLALVLSLLGAVSRTKATKDNTDIKSRVLAEVKRVYTNRLNQETISEPMDEEYLRRSDKANLAYNKIMSHVFSTDDVLRSVFAGAYMDAVGNLVVMLNEDNVECKELITNVLKCEEVVFFQGHGNYYATMKKLADIDECIASMQEAVIGDCADEETKKLMRMYPRTEYKDTTNTIQIFVDVEEPLLPYVLGENVQEPDSEMQKRVDEYNEGISLLEEIIQCDAEMVSVEIVPGTGYQQGEDLTITWRPGRFIFVVAYGATQGSTLSTGYRAQYTYSGTTKYGFVTCAHGNSIGDLVCVSNTGSPIQLGTIIDRTYVGRLDVAFMEFTNSNYTNGQAIYYTDSIGGTTQGDVLDGTWTLATENQLIYKSGATTYLTAGYVESTSASGYFNNVYFFGMIKADRSMAASGDSGGVTYATYGTNSAKAIGIVKGSLSDTKTVFIKADRIEYLFYAQPY